MTLTFIYTSVNPVHNAPVPPPPAVTYFGLEATSPLAWLFWMLPGAASQTSSKKKKIKKEANT